MERAEGPEKQPGLERAHHVAQECTNVPKLTQPVSTNAKMTSSANARTSFHFSKVGATSTPQSRSE